MKKFMLIITMLLSMLFTQLSAATGYEDNPYANMDLNTIDYSVKPNWTDDRHRCSDKDVKRIIGKNFIAGSWTGEYTITYDPRYTTREGDIVKIYARMFPTSVSLTATKLDEGYNEVMMLFNTRSKTMAIMQAQAFGCNGNFVRRYQQAGTWMPVGKSEEFLYFYRNVVSKIK